MIESVGLDDSDISFTIEDELGLPRWEMPMGDRTLVSVYDLDDWSDEDAAFDASTLAIHFGLSGSAPEWLDAETGNDSRNRAAHGVVFTATSPFRSWTRT